MPDLWQQPRPLQRGPAPSPSPRPRRRPVHPTCQAGTRSTLSPSPASGSRLAFPRVSVRVPEPPALGSHGRETRATRWAGRQEAGAEAKLKREAPDRRGRNPSGAASTRQRKHGHAQALWSVIWFLTEQVRFRPQAGDLPAKGAVRAVSARRRRGPSGAFKEHQVWLPVRGQQG